MKPQSLTWMVQWKTSHVGIYFVLKCMVATTYAISVSKTKSLSLPVWQNVWFFQVSWVLWPGSWNCWKTGMNII